MYKVLRSERLDLALMAGIDPRSEGLALARSMGLATSTDGIAPILQDRSIRIVWDATSAKAHRQEHAAALRAAGKIAVDLTPAAIGVPVSPAVNLDRVALSGRTAVTGGIPGEVSNVNLVSCGGQATIPIVAAVSRKVPVRYAEIAATISSRSAGPGTRQNIDEFTQTTARGLVEIGGAERGKAMIILNPADSPICMRNTIYCGAGFLSPAF